MLNRRTKWHSQQKGNSLYRSLDFPENDFAGSRILNPTECKLTLNDTQLPEYFSFKKLGVVTPVKSQQCGDCYIHAIMGALEARYMLQINGSDMRDFSRQDVLNCYDEDEKKSCDGGSSNEVMQLLLGRGLELEQDEPYIGKVCHLFPV